MEFAYINGPGSKHARSHFNNIKLIGRTDPEAKVALPSFFDAHDGGGYTQCELDPHLSAVGTVTGCVHGIHLSGIASEVTYSNIHFANYEAAVWGCAWCVDLRGGYEQSFEKVTYSNVDRVATWRFANAGIINDLDASMSWPWLSVQMKEKVNNNEVSGALSVVPFGQFYRNTYPDCEAHTSLGSVFSVFQHWYVVCSIPVRRVTFSVDFYSVYMNSNRLFQFPYIQLKDITDHVHRGGDMEAFDNLASTSMGKGPTSCFPQSPSGYMLLAPVGRHMSLQFYDQNEIRVSAGVSIQVKDMEPDETMIFSITMNPRYENPLYRAWSSSTDGWNRFNEQGPSKGWQGPPELPDYKLNSRAMRWSGACSQDDFESGKEGCKKCANGISYLGGCAGNTWDEKTGLELRRRPDPSDKKIISKPRGLTSEGGFLSPVNGWPGKGIKDDDYAENQYCHGPAEECANKFQSHVYKKQACIVVDNFVYQYGQPFSGSVKVVPCNLDRSWQRFQSEIKEGYTCGINGKSLCVCGSWGYDCLDIWRMNYDWMAITRGPQFGGVLTGSRGVDRNDGWTAESIEEENYKVRTTKNKAEETSLEATSTPPQFKPTNANLVATHRFARRRTTP